MPRQVALLQVRDDPAAEAQERLCFQEAARLRPEQLDCINLIYEPDVTWERVRGADALFMGGAGSHTATREYPFSSPLLDLVIRWVEEGRPLFGSCWGHHFLVEAFGGDVVTDSESAEIGTFDVELTDLGRNDPLFAGFPATFPAQLGHHDRVEKVPDRFDELALSERCRSQVLRMRDRPVYSTQFHSEMSDHHLKARLLMYGDTYLQHLTTAEELSASLRPSPHVEVLLSRFLDLYAS